MFKSLIPKLKTYFRNPGDIYFISPREIRLGLAAAIIVYTIFGIVDWFMLPESYTKAWIVRFFMVSPAFLILFFFTENKIFVKYAKVILTILILGGQLGIISMLWIAKPNELGRYEYFAGMILVLLWAGFVFRLSNAQMIFVCICNVLFYDIVAVFIHRLPFNGVNSIEFAYFVNNNFLLISASALAAVGTIQLNKFYVRVQEQNTRLEKEKEELERAKKKAEESERLKSAFLTNMSHEIRTPMNAILGFTELMKKKNISEIKEKQYIDIIQKKGRQLEQLINDIIDLSRIEANEISLNKTTINLNLFIDELVLSTRELLISQNKSEQIQLKVSKGVPDKNFYLETDIIRLRQILSNLLHNAVRFTHQGQIELGYEKPADGQIIYFVRDTGIGISEKDHKIVFERFRQVEDSLSKVYDGTGLGLNIVQNLAQIMGGEIHLESKIGKGSEFILKLPVSISQGSFPENSDKKVDSEGKINWSTKQVLITEDDDNNFFVLEEFLESTGINITRAKNGKEALDIIGKSTFDIVLMDIKIPEINGFDLTTIIKQQKPGLPIVVQTAYALNDDIEWLNKSGCDDIITKPIQRGKLLRTMNKYLV